MRIITILFLLLGSLCNAQHIKNIAARNIAYADTKAPIGLDLMYGKKQGITVYPNATNDRILISVAGKSSESKSFQIYNLSGQVIFRSGICYENTYLVDVSEVPNDLYVVEVKSGSKTYLKKWLRK